MAELYSIVEPEELFEAGSYLGHTLADAGKRRMAVMNGTKIYLRDRGILEVLPARTVSGAPSVVLSAGVHGNETAPMEIIDSVVRDLLSGSLIPACRLLILIGNPEAAVIQSRFVEQNLNRLFSGAFLGADSLEAGRAALLTGAVDRFFSDAGNRRVHYDLHTAMRASEHERFVVVPHGSTPSNGQLRFFADSEIQAVLLANRPATTFSYFSANDYDAEAFTIELGKVQPFGQNDLSRMGAIQTSLRSLIRDDVVTTSPESNVASPNHQAPPRTYSVIAEVLRHCDEEFVLHLDPEVPNFTELPVGYQLTSGQGGGFRVSEPRSAIVFPNAAVPVSERVALLVQEHEAT